ncbi:hypothetical protein [Flavobacterium sp.]|jgi:hypothetical protein|uniref:hypothetical protein n=1 Tax=Flavobacterium sp. TaxID=239 RepID=UPI0037BEF7B1
MKTFKSIFLQLLLSLVAVASWINCHFIGNNSEGGTYLKPTNDDYETVGTSIDAGYNGGALGMGIICSVCIIMIVWLEINKKANK